MSHRAVIELLLAEVAAFTLVVLLILGHGGWLAWQRRADPPRLARARQVLAALLAEGADAADVAAALPRLPLRLRTRLLTDLSRNLRGAQRERLGALARAMGVTALARRWVHSRWWWRRLRGAHLLTQLADDDPVLDRLLNDPHPVVRAEATAWAATHADGPLAQRLIDVLDDESMLCRHTAADALLRAGPALAPWLAEQLDGERRARLPALLEIAAARPDPRYLPAALRLAGSARPHLRVRATRLLGALGGNAATEALTGRLADDDPAVREAAVVSLGHLRHWPAAPAVARLLRDPSWDVRRASGEALLALGAPGWLLLRRYEHDEDRFAADMAQRVLRTAELQSAGAPG